MESEKKHIFTVQTFFPLAFLPSPSNQMSKRFPPLLEGEYYHIYNRGNNREQIFFTDFNYNFFLNKIKSLILPFAHVYCYCLLPNHFHLFIRIKSITEFLPANNRLATAEQIVSNQFRKLFISYSQLINNQQNRTGSLFEKNFRRKPISNDAYFSYLVFYIHSNPEKHGLIDDYQNYIYSSFSKIGIHKHPWLNEEELISWFGTIKEFHTFHEINRPMVQIEKLVESLRPV